MTRSSPDPARSRPARHRSAAPRTPKPALARLPALLLVLLVVAVAAGPPDAAAAAEEAAATVRPGGLVRWSGAGTTLCRLQGETFPPAGETCVYPVDLLADPGTLTVERRAGGEWREARVRVGEYPYPVQHLRIEDEGKVNLSPEDLARARSESARVGKLWDLRTERRFRLPLAPPLDDLPAGGRFGARRFFNDQPRSPHSGADYSVPAGTPVKAVADGRVVLAADHFFSGKSVFLDHGDGLVSMYFHLSGVAVEEGEEIRRGEILGTVGATGRATGPHLHFGLRWRGARIDPSLLLEPVESLPAVGQAGG